MKIYATVIGITLVIFVGLFLFIDYKREQREEEVYIQDSLKTYSFNSDSVYSFEMIKNYYTTFGINARNDERYIGLVTILDSVNILVDVGKVHYDWLTETKILEKPKLIETKFVNYIKNPEKYTPEKIYNLPPGKKYKRGLELFKKYHWKKEDCITIAEGKISIGMNKDMVLEAWGRPNDINKTTTAYVTREQWVYESGNYCYFEGDVLTTIQN